MPRMTIIFGIERKGLALVTVSDLELGGFLNFFRQTFDARFALIVRADCEIQFVKGHESILNLNADFGVVDALSR